MTDKKLEEAFEEYIKREEEVSIASGGTCNIMPPNFYRKCDFIAGARWGKANPENITFEDRILMETGRHFLSLYQGLLDRGMVPEYDHNGLLGRQFWQLAKDQAEALKEYQKYNKPKAPEGL